MEYVYLNQPRHLRWGDHPKFTAPAVAQFRTRDHNEYGEDEVGCAVKEFLAHRAM